MLEHCTLYGGEVLEDLPLQKRYLSLVILFDILSVAGAVRGCGSSKACSRWFGPLEEWTLDSA